MTTVSGKPNMVLAGVTFELLEETGGIATVRETMPPGNALMAAPHRHPTAEGVEVVSGRLRLTHGYDEALMEKELGPGEQVLVGPGEWHGLANATADAPLVLLLRHDPGEQWAAFVRDGAALAQQTGSLPDGFVFARLQDIGVEMKR